MFPLSTVLMPHMPLTVRIFEERYQRMLGVLLEAEPPTEPHFGVVLIERGHEAGGGDRRFPIGTMARIDRVVSAAPDDFVVFAHGTHRVDVVSWQEDAPYPQAHVSPIAELPWSPTLEPLRHEAERVVRRVLTRASEFADVGWDPAIELSDAPIASSWQLAGIAPIPDVDRMALLRSDSLAELLAGVIALTRDAEPALTAASTDAEFADAIAQLLAEPGDQIDKDDRDDDPDESKS